MYGIVQVQAHCSFDYCIINCVPIDLNFQIKFVPREVFPHCDYTRSRLVKSKINQIAASNICVGIIMTLGNPKDFSIILVANV